MDEFDDKEMHVVYQTVGSLIAITGAFRVAKGKEEPTNRLTNINKAKTVMSEDNVTMFESVKKLVDLVEEEATAAQSKGPDPSAAKRQKKGR